MKRLVVIPLLLVILLPLWGRSPRLVIPRNDVWIGRLAADTVMDFSFTVRNDGDQPLSILRVNRACNCNEASFPTTPISPGDSAEISLRIFAEKIAPGDFLKYVTVVSNDPDYTKRFYFSGEILSSEHHNK